MNIFTSRKNRVIVNTVPHSGTHLVSSVLDMISFSHAKYFNWRSLSFDKIFLNWQTSSLSNNKNLDETDRKFKISVASPQLVREDLVELILNKIKNNQYLLSHTPHSKLFEELLINLGFLGLSVIRDPRDMCLSMINHIKQRPHHYAYDLLFNKMNDRQERLFQIIQGFNLNVNDSIRNFGNMEKMVQSILPWGQVDNYLLLKFEDY